MGDRRRIKRREALTASVAPASEYATTRWLIQPKPWQLEAWDFFHALGEVHYGISDWFGNGMSRIRLMAAITRPNQDPMPIKDGPVAELVAQLGGGTGGHAALLKKLAIHLSVPGESYLVGEDQDLNGTKVRTWTIYSNSEIRVAGINERGGFGTPVVNVIQYDVMYAEDTWRRLGEESLVVRIWNPDAQFQYKAYSAVGAALTVMREVDYYNRHIIATLLSRLTMNGMLMIPSEVSFPTKEGFEEADDPFITELLDIARKSIANPGSPQAAMPFPIRVPAEMIEKFKHLTFSTEVGKDVIENRNRALQRLATSINIPGEVLTGMDNMNHWGQWQLEESAVKIHFSPLAEVICVGLTAGYLVPMLAAAGLPLEDKSGGKYIIWYDPSPITQAPDRSKPSQDLYDRGEVDGELLRRANGFDENDKPSTKELKEQVLQKIALAGGPEALFALSKLINDDSVLPPEPPPAPEPPQGPNAPPPPPVPPSGSDTKQAPNTRPQDEVVQS